MNRRHLLGSLVAILSPQARALYEPEPMALFRGLPGRWRGSLTYRDWSPPHGLVSLPCDLFAALNSPSQASLYFVFQDGPAKVVHSYDRWTVGDVLLATPVIRSLRRHWPEAAIDMLVFRGTEGVLAGNPDIRRVLTIAERPSASTHLALAARLWRRYDLSISLVPSDRPTAYAWLAGRRSCGLVVNAAKHRWKQWLLDISVDYDNSNTHTVNLYLRTLDPLGVQAITEVVAARPDKDMIRIDALLRETGVAGDFAVMHASPKFPYKMWTPDGWCEAGRWLQNKGLQLVLTGGPDADERAYVGAIAAQLPGALNLAGKASLAETACLLAQARLYIGPDTAVTHLAAAVGTPTVALFGPTDPAVWAPRGNDVHLISAPAPCPRCPSRGHENWSSLAPASRAWVSCSGP